MPELKLENSLVDGQYEVHERLSRGSYAEIFVARDRFSGGREVVIKALNTSLQGTPDADLERTLVENFQNEAIALDTVRHPNVILRWGHGTAADLRGTPFHYLVLEYMPGGDLLNLCRSQPGNALPLDKALFYFRQACEALAFAHSKGIIHRDLKPNNLLLSADQQMLKIADFGVAKIATGELTEITRVGADVYAPPEHHPDEDAQYDQLTAAADTYSLAKSFYTVICGRAPSQFKCDPISSLADRASGKPWSTKLLTVLRRATDDDPGERYASVIEFWSDLAQVAAIAHQVIDDEITIIKPRLSVNSGALPRTPEQPEFEPTLASSRPLRTYSSASPVPIDEEPVDGESGSVVSVAPQPLPVNDNDRRRPSRFFIELKDNLSAPATPIERATSTVVDTSAAAGLRPAQAKTAQPSAQPAAKPVITADVASGFTETLRRRLFLLLIGVAFLGALLSVYGYFRGLDTPFGFGPVTELEVLAPGLNVRAGPSPRDPAIGVVSKGSRHKVLAQTDQKWMQIEVSRWDESQPRLSGYNQGWVYGNPQYVRVVSRRFWR